MPSTMTTVTTTSQTLLPHATILIGKALETMTDTATTTTSYATNLLHDQKVTIDEAPIISIEELGRLSPDSLIAMTHALLASFSVILVSELGDKTFIVTALMAMKYSRLPVFLASASAMLIMTVLSIVLGVAVTVIPEIYTHYGSIVLFVFYGLKMLKESYDMHTEGECSEFEEVEKSLDEQEARTVTQLQTNNFKDGKLVNEKENPSLGGQKDSNAQDYGLTKTINVAPLFIKVFTMVFVAEWGDRSQISTIILAAREDIVGVFIGSFGGHVLCTGLAVIGGRFLADMISVKTVTLIGGIVFLVFALVDFVHGPS